VSPVLICKCIQLFPFPDFVSIVATTNICRSYQQCAITEVYHILSYLLYILKMTMTSTFQDVCVF